MNVVGENLLAGARFAINEDREIHLAKLFSHLSHGTHGLRLTKNNLIWGKFQMVAVRINRPHVVHKPKANRSTHSLLQHEVNQSAWD